MPETPGRVSESVRGPETGTITEGETITTASAEVSGLAGEALDAARSSDATESRMGAEEATERAEGLAEDYDLDPAERDAVARSLRGGELTDDEEEKLKDKAKSPSYSKYTAIGTGMAIGATMFGAWKATKWLVRHGRGIFSSIQQGKPTWAGFKKEFWDAFASKSDKGKK